MFEQLRKLAQRHHRAIDRDDVEIRVSLTPFRVSVDCDTSGGPVASFLVEMSALLDDARPLLPAGVFPIEMTFAPVPMQIARGRRLDSALTEVGMAGITLAAPKTEEAEKSLMALKAMCGELGPGETQPLKKQYRGPGRRDYVVIEDIGQDGPPIVTSGRVSAVGPAGAFAKHLAVKQHVHSMKSDAVLEMARSGELSRFSVTEAPIPADELFSFGAPESEPDTGAPEL